MLNCRNIVTASIAALSAALFLAGLIHAAPPAGYRLIWSDEFDGTEIDPRNWTRFRDDFGIASGIDRVDATYVEDGHLTVAAYTDFRGRHVGGSIITRQRESFHYGYFEVRARFRGEQGLNQAFWIQSPTMTLTNGNVPGNPDIYGSEIDVMEHRTYDGSGTWIADQVSQGIHWDGYGADHKSSSGLTPPNFGNFNQTWHTFALEWTPGGYKYFVDGVQTRNITQAVSARDHHIILSNAIFPAGNWTNGPPAEGYGTLAEKRHGMDIDYVRAYASSVHEVTAEDQIVSVNFTNSGAASHQVQGAYGVPAESSVVDGWLNLNTTVGVVGGLFREDNLNFRDGRRSAIDVTVNKPYSGGAFASVYDGTPAKAGLTDFVTSPDSIEVTLEELDHAFESGYKVIAFLTGYEPNRGASISDGTTTFYFQTPDPSESTLLQTSDTNPADGIPVANYAVFGGDFDPLFAESLTLTLDTLDFEAGHAPGFGGLQIVGVQQLFGDFSRDGVIAAEDLDLLTAELGTGNSIYNLNNFTDSVVDDEDRRLWLEYVAETTFGDANLDGTVDLVDLQLLANNWQAVGIGWGGADFSGDGITDELDVAIAEAYWDPAGELTFYEAAVAAGLLVAGDFDRDGGVGGIDLLIWQQGGSPEPYSTTNLAEWESNFGPASGASVGEATSVPEPATWALLASLSWIALKRMRN